MRRLLVAFAAVALLVPALVLPAAAATKTIPPTAFKPLANYDPAEVTIITSPMGLSIFASTSPDTRQLFWAEVKLPVGATITRVNYWYADPEARGTRLLLLSSRWGTATGETKAEITTAATAGAPTKVSTTAITKPKVTAGETIFLHLELTKGSACAGVKIDYTP